MTTATTPAVLTVDLPGLRVNSEMNRREHWTATNRRKQDQQHEVFYCLYPTDADTAKRLRLAPKLRVTFTRLIGPRGKEFDTDNLASAFKFVRDAVATWLHKDDGTASGVDWVTEQARHEFHGVRIHIEEVPA